jgi:hypothetical protein
VDVQTDTRGLDFQGPCQKMVVPLWEIVISNKSRCVLNVGVCTAQVATSSNTLPMFMQNMTTGNHAMFVGKCLKLDSTCTHIYFRPMVSVRGDWRIMVAWQCQVEIRCEIFERRWNSYTTVSLHNKQWINLNDTYGKYGILDAVSSKNWNGISEWTEHCTCMLWCENLWPLLNKMTAEWCLD